MSQQENTPISKRDKRNLILVASMIFLIYTLTIISLFTQHDSITEHHPKKKKIETFLFDPMYHYKIELKPDGSTRVYDTAGKLYIMDVDSIEEFFYSDNE